MAGYGDIAATDRYSKVVLCLYLPTAVAALADALAQVQQIGTAKSLMETDFAEQADTLLLGEAGGANPNPEETLTEAEFLISVLKDNDIVDDLTVNAIRLQFAHITRHGGGTVENRVLDDKMVFLEMKAQGRIVQSSPSAPSMTRDGHKIEHVDLSVSDGGFAEWLERHWWPRVFDGKPVAGQVRLEPKGNSNRFMSEAKKKAAGKGGGAKGAGGYARLDEEKGGNNSHRSPRILPPKKGAYEMEGQMAATDGEWVYMPKEQAARAKGGSASFDRDAPLWILLTLFLVYFVWKMLPDIMAGNAPAIERRALAADSSSAASSAASAAASAALTQLSALARARVGDMVSEDMLGEIAALLPSQR